MFAINAAPAHDENENPFARRKPQKVRVGVSVVGGSTGDIARFLSGCANQSRSPFFRGRACLRGHACAFA